MTTSPARAVAVPERTAAVAGRGRLLIGFYVLAVFSVEVVLAYVDVFWGLALNAGLLIAMLTHYSFRATGRLPNAGGRPSWQALPAIALVPALKILHAAIPLPGVEPVFSTAFAASLLLLGAFVGAKRLHLDWSSLGIAVRRGHVQALIGFSGAAIGLFGWALTTTQPAPARSSYQILTISIVLVLAACAEELLFRGLIQAFIERACAACSVMASGILYSAAYLGLEQTGAVLFATAAGFYFAWGVKRTKSIAGAALAHALTNVGMFVVWPMLQG